MNEGSVFVFRFSSVDGQEYVFATAPYAVFFYVVTFIKQYTSRTGLLWFCFFFCHSFYNTLFFFFVLLAKLHFHMGSLFLFSIFVSGY